jgi:hypothetical protein
MDVKNTLCRVKRIYRIVHPALRLGLVLLVLNACASSPPVDPIKLAKIQEISLSGFAEPEYKALYGIPPYPVGPSLSSPADAFNTAMGKQNLHLGADLKSAITNVLENSGYHVEQTKTDRTDAVLNVSLSGNFAAYIGEPPILGGTYGPAITIDVRLTNAISGETLFRQTYFYSTSDNTGLTGRIALVAEQKYVFADVDALFNNPQLAAEGLRAASPILAKSIATKLAKH